jgi:cation transport protein ChaC
MSTWLFGYGSLIFRPGFPFEERLAAVVEGFERRLDQGSPDHRGTPERLGRVATLAAAPGRKCGGVLYRLADDGAAAILDALDVREQGGYDRIEIDATTLGVGEGRIVRAITWVATHSNPYHLGPAPLDAMVAQIRGAVGPSGANVDYVLALDEALRALGLDDPHVAEVAAALQAVPG